MNAQNFLLKKANYPISVDPQIPTEEDKKKYDIDLYDAGEIGGGAGLLGGAGYQFYNTAKKHRLADEIAEKMVKTQKVDKAAGNEKTADKLKSDLRAGAIEDAEKFNAKELDNIEAYKKAGTEEQFKELSHKLNGSKKALAAILGGGAVMLGSKFLNPND